MKKLLLMITLALFSFSVSAAKPEWAGGGKEAKQAAKEEKKANKHLKKSSEKVKEHKDNDKDEKRGLLSGLFSDEDRETIRDYYNENAASGTGKHKGKLKELPKGLQKKLERGGELPPGWQKKVAKGEVLSPELRAHATALPRDLLSRIPGGERAGEILRVGDKIIRVGHGQGTVDDIIDLADILSGAL